MRYTTAKKYFKLLCYYRIYIFSLFWDLIEKLPNGKNLVQDFYPFREYKNQGRYNLLDVLLHPINFVHYSFTFNFLRDWHYWKYKPFKEKVQRKLFGENNYKILNWLVQKEDSKLLQQDGRSAYIRNREADTKYYDMRIYPFNYFVIKEIRFLDEDGTGANMYGKFVQAMLGDTPSEIVKKEESIIFSGYINNLADVLRIARAYSLAYSGKRWFWDCTKEFRKWRNNV